jgi:hypothetical protein
MVWRDEENAMRYASLILFALAVLLVEPHVVSVAANETVTHSGTVLAIDVRGGQLVFEEIGPWRARSGVMQTIRRTVELVTATRFTFASRTDAPCGLVGAWVEGPLDPVFLEVGDAITIECRHEGARLIAVKVIVTDMR